MRSSREIVFRLRQEAANLALFLKPPVLPGARQIPRLPLVDLADPTHAARSLEGSAYAARLRELAEQILLNKLPLLGHEAVELGGKIEWRRDPFSGVESPLRYFRRVPYLDARLVGDQKMVWELNRHAHLVVLAQAWRLTGEARYKDHLFAQLEDWWRDNPFQQGMNWTAALEVAFRALNWIWVYHLAGSAMDEAFGDRFLTELYRHGWHLAENLSVYASPNTHLLGEAVALHAIGRLFPQFPRAAEWRARGRDVVQSHMETHVLGDGMYFEQTTYYQVYALDMFLFHAVIETTPEAYRERLKAMAQLAESIAGPMKRLPFLGDDDGGRFFHPYGPRSTFQCGSLAVAERLLRIDLGAASEDQDEMAIWWMGPDPASSSTKKLTSQHWPASGLVSMVSGGTHVLVDAGSFGAGTAGHSHADTLSMVVRDGERDLLIDPGTFCYLSNPAEREWFRSTAAHNTVCVDGLNQATPVNLFRWTEVPRVETTAWTSNAVMDNLEARCQYRGLTHSRQVVFLKQERLVCVLDVVDGAEVHEAVQSWLTPAGVPEGRGLRMGDAVLMSALLKGIVGEVEFDEGWYSPALSVKRLGRVMRVRVRGGLPLVLGAVLDLDGRYEEVTLEQQASTWCFSLKGGVVVKMGSTPHVDLYTSSAERTEE